MPLFSLVGAIMNGIPIRPTPTMERHYAVRYGKVLSPDRVRVVTGLVLRYLRSRPAGPIRLLDIGCGDGAALDQVVRGIRAADGGDAWPVEAQGWELSPLGAEEVRRRGIPCAMTDVVSPVHGEDAGSRDVILFTEVLEHVVDTGTAVDNIYQLLRPGGALVLTTPNLASWYNRFFLLFGFQPHMTEVSFDPYRFGCRFLERVFGESPGEATPAGHVRLFTYRALLEFLAHHRFRVLRTRGVATHGDALSRLISSVWVGGAGDVAVLAQRPTEE